MAKNELLPFADGEDANVLPTSQWEALTDIIENGFQSGIARSEQVNRVLSQGAVASYVLGQLIVDQLNKDATLDKDTLYQNLISALQENAKDACLPLAGGTMTGKITSSSERVLDSTNANGLFIVADASVSSTETGAMSVFPVNHSQANRAGGFQLVASDGTNNKTLTGHYTNGLKWGGKSVICVESWSSGTSWYRKYSDGWIEQGGMYVSTKDNSFNTVTLNIAFSNTNYTITTTNISTYGSGSSSSHAYVMAAAAVVNPNNKTTTSFGVFKQNSGGNGYWRACGY